MLSRLGRCAVNARRVVAVATVCGATVCGAASCGGSRGGGACRSEPTASRGASTGDSGPRSRHRRVHPARWFPIAPTRPESRFADAEPDGSVHAVIARGLRLVERPAGRLERAADLLPSDAPGGALRLPPRVSATASSSSAVAQGVTRIWRAPTWTSRLVPLVKLPFEAAEVDAGLDRLYAVSARTRAIVGVDAATGGLHRRGPAAERPCLRGCRVLRRLARRRGGRCSRCSRHLRRRRHLSFASRTDGRPGGV